VNKIDRQIRELKWFISHRRINEFTELKPSKDLDPLPLGRDKTVESLRLLLCCQNLDISMHVKQFVLF
jgi:hypothetical protein